MTNSIDATRQPVVSIKNGEVFANSRDVAAYFEKRHDHVMRDIDNLIAAEPSLGMRQFPDGGVPNFGETPYVEPSNGQTYRSYDMTRDGFSLLAMGFTGQKALRFKLKYIEQFNAMEASLHNRPALPDLSDPVVLVQLLTEHASKRIEAEKRADDAERKVEEVKPKADFYDAYLNADGLYGLQNAARALGCRPNLFVRWLKENYVFYQGGNLVARVQYIQAGLFEIRTTIVEDKVRPQAFITPKGLKYLAGRVPDAIKVRAA